MMLCMTVHKNQVENDRSTFLWGNNVFVGDLWVWEGLNSIHMGPGGLFKELVCDSVEMILIQIVYFCCILLTNLGEQVAHKGLHHLGDCGVGVLGRQLRG